jgi:hypothetical protein
MATDSTSNTTSADTVAQAQQSASENLAVQQQLKSPRVSKRNPPRCRKSGICRRRR